MQMWRCFAVALALVACGKSETKAPAPGSASGSTVAPVADGLEVFVNDKSVAKLSMKELEAWPRLDTLVPMDARRIGSWTSVTVRGASEKPVELQRPGDHYRDQVLALFAADGKPAFGVFDPVELAKKGAPSLKETRVSEIRIVADTSGGRGQNESGAGGGTDPLAIVIAIKTPAGESKFTGEQLLKLPREDQPGGDTKGWKLSSILAAAQITKYEKLILSDAGGTSLQLAKGEFDDKDVVPFIKLNKGGQLRLRVYKKQGEGWGQSGDLRGLATIEAK